MLKSSKKNKGGGALKLKEKKCKVCKNLFKQSRPMQNVCNWKCAADLVKLKEQKKKDAEFKEMKARVILNDRPRQLKYAQTAFNRWILLRDKDLPCICCGTYTAHTYHASHFRSRGSCPELSFHEDNVWKGCERCNMYLGGNLVNYRINLVKRIGIERVEFLEGPHDTGQLKINNILAIKEKYSVLCRAMS